MNLLSLVRSGTLVTLAILCSSHAFSRPVLTYPPDPPEAPSPVTNTYKLGSMAILSNASANIPQELLVEFNAGTLETDVATLRVGLDGMAHALSAGQAATDQQLVSYLQAQLSTIKNSVFPYNQLAGSSVVRDFPNSPVVLVSVPNASALGAILANTRVKNVNQNAPIAPAANWPAAYEDIDIVTGGLRNTGPSNVAVLDTAANIAAVTGGGSIPCSLQRNFDGTLAQLSLSTGGCKIFYALNFTLPTSQIENYCYTGACGQSSHGTLTMDIVARISQQTKILAMQVYDANGNGREAYIVAALDWLIGHRNNGYGITTINISSEVNPGTKYSTTCPELNTSSRMSTLNTYGIVTIVASGNRGWKDGVSAPACAPTAVAVGATTDSVTPAKGYAPCSDPALGVDQVACFSNSHPTLMALLAPGVNIGDPRNLATGRQDGTSAAAPHVAGVYAALKGWYGNTYSSTQLINMMKTYGTPVTDRLAPSITLTRVSMNKVLRQAPVQYLTFPQTSVAINPGATTVKPTIQARDTYNELMPLPSITWSSSNSNIATVAADGRVTGVMPGTVTIFARSGNASGSFSATVQSPIPTFPNPCLTNPAACI